ENILNAPNRLIPRPERGRSLKLWLDPQGRELVRDVVANAVVVGRAHRMRTRRYLFDVTHGTLGRERDVGRGRWYRGRRAGDAHHGNRAKGEQSDRRAEACEHCQRWLEGGGVRCTGRSPAASACHSADLSSSACAIPRACHSTSRAPLTEQVHVRRGWCWQNSACGRRSRASATDDRPHARGGRVYCAK